MRRGRVRLLIGTTLLALTHPCMGGQSVEQISPDWFVSDVGPGVTPVFAFGAGDDIHLLWHADESQQENGPVTYAHAPGLSGPWAKQVLTSGYFYGPGDLIVARDGRAHLVFHDHLGNPRHFVIAEDSSFTEFLVPSAGTHDGWDASLAFDSTGILHLSAVAPVLHGAKASLEHGMFDGATWSFKLVENTEPFMYGLGTSLAIDSADTVRIAFNTADDRLEPGDLMIASRTLSAWTLESVTLGGLRGRFPGLAVDSADRLHIAWFDSDEADTRRGVVRYGVKEGDDWKVEVVAPFEAVRLELVDARRPLTLLLDSQGVPHLAFGDARNVIHAERGENAWTITTVLESSEDLYRGTAVMRLDSTGNPLIATWQDSELNPQGTIRLLSRRMRPAPLFHRGDPDSSGFTDISDAVRIFGFLFLGLAKPSCLESADTNNSGRVDISDGVFLLQHLFSGGVTPPPPGFSKSPCGADPDVPGSPSDLGCESYSPCGA